MKRKAIAFFVGLLVMGAVGPAFASDPTLLIDYVGFDYESPDPTPSTFGELGSGYASLGEVPGLFAPLVPDFVNNVYTYYIHGSVAVNQQVVGPFIVVTYSPGVLEVWEDNIGSGTAADYGVNPPNGTSPGTFSDGTLFVSGPLTNFQFVFNTTSNSGSFEGTYEVTGGSQLGNVPANERLGWTFAGATKNALNIPQGYAHQIDGQVFLNKPVPAQDTSWGRIKANYR